MNKLIDLFPVFQDIGSFANSPQEKEKFDEFINDMFQIARQKAIDHVYWLGRYLRDNGEESFTRNLEHIEVEAKKNNEKEIEVQYSNNQIDYEFVAKVDKHYKALSIISSSTPYEEVQRFSLNSLQNLLSFNTEISSLYLALDAIEFEKSNF